MSPEQKLGLDVLDYEYENIMKFIKPIIEFIKEADYQDKYTEIYEMLSWLQNEIYRNIDDATIL